MLFFCAKSNETSKKYSSLRSFWYLCQLLTPNSLRERSDERWDLDLDFRQGGDVTEFLCISFVFDCTSLLGGIPNQDLIFHRTVLEGYWELGAGIGIQMTATNCTFGSFRYFYHRKTTLLWKSWKTVKLWCQNTTLISKMLVKMLDRIQKITYQNFVYPPIPFLVPTLSACATESQSEHFLL